MTAPSRPLASPPGLSPMTMLAQGVPLTLLLDLALGPRSEDLLREEAPRLPRQHRHLVGR